MKLTFLGTGTSQGVPVIGCSCNVCQSENPKDKRLRTSAMIEVDEVKLVIDTGPDFRQQMLRENVQNIDAVLFTHEHKDHVAGLDDVRPFNFKHQKSMPIYCTDRVLDGLKREFHYVFDPKFNYPGIPKIDPVIITNKSFMVKGVEVNPVLLWHYKLPVFGFRIKNLSYLTDVNKIDKVEKAKLKNLDVLVLSALRIEPHISHYTLSEALEVINELKPKRAYLTHASHFLGTHNTISAELPSNVFLAYDGLVVEA